MHTKVLSMELNHKDRYRQQDATQPAAFLQTIDTPAAAARTLVLLDDEPRVLRSLQRLLAGEGYQIHTFTRPYDALEILESTPVGVIIADQSMPQMEGTEFLRRALLKQPLAVPISLSGYWSPDKRVSRRPQSPVWRFMSKPWSNSELRQTVAEAFARYQHQIGAPRVR